MIRLRPIVVLIIIAISFSFAEKPKAYGIFKKQALQNKKGVGEVVEVNSVMTQKTDPLFRKVFSDANKALREGKDIFDGNYNLRLNKEGSVVLPVMIKTADVRETVEQLNALGATVRTIAGDIMTVDLPLNATESVLKSSNVIAMQISSFSQPSMDVSHIEVGADQVHAGVGLPGPHTGLGVVVGVLDSGIDWKHPDFDWADGSSRIQWLWDMSGTSGAPAGYTYGTEYTKAQIDVGNSAAVDGDGGGGHGTHVAGTAAGSGIANNAYVGVAPESDIVFVKGVRAANSGGGFADTDVIDGCAYIFSKADQLNQPAVINLSLGGHFGPHDGTSLYEQALDNLTGPGKIIVAAAGNEGGSLVHAGYAAQAGTGYNDALETVWVFNGSNTITATDIWYPSSGNISFGVAWYDAYGQLINYTTPVAPGGKVDSVLAGDYYNTYGLVSIDATTVSDPNNGHRRVLVIIDSDQNTLPTTQVFWSLYSFGSGTFDAWLITGGNFTQDDGGFFRAGNSISTVGIPSTATKVVSVGSYVTKGQWQDLNGNTQQQLNNAGIDVTIGDISWFSSRGPTRDGRTSPDISAPGEAILSALSSDLTIGVGVQATNILFGGNYQKQQGTSMASPHVAGTVGLMLENNPNLTYDDVVGILSSTAYTDGWTGTVPNNTFGDGKLDALAAVQQVQATSIEADGIGVAKNYILEQNYPNPFNPETTIRYQIPERAEVQVTVYNVQGQKVATLVNGVQDQGEYQISWRGEAANGSKVASGVYFYRLSAGSFVQTRKMLLVQ